MDQDKGRGAIATFKSLTETKYLCWNNKELYDFAYVLLTNGYLVKNKIVDKEKIIELLSNLRSVIPNNSYGIWQLISTEIWIKVIIDDCRNWMN